MDRDPSVILASDMARCEPSDVCAVRHRCARGMAPLPDRMAIVADWSIFPHGGTMLCDGYLCVRTVRKQDQARPAPKPWPGA